MPSIFSSEFIDEPDLVFGGQKEEKDPRIGLRYHDPYHYSGEKEPSPNRVRVGIIGNSTTITLAKKILEKLKGPIESPSSNKWLAPNYPGFSQDTAIKCDFVTSTNWEAIIKDSEIKKHSAHAKIGVKLDTLLSNLNPSETKRHNMELF